MARELNHGAIEVGIKPTLVCIARQDVTSVLIQNISDVPVFVGSHDVAADGERRGIMIAPGASQTIPSYENDSSTLYAVVAPKNDEGKQDGGKDDDVTATVVFMISH